MEKRLVLFLVLSFALVMGQTLLVNWLWPPQRPAAQAPAAEGEALAEDAGGEKPGDELPPKIVVEVDESTADPAAEAAAGERGAEATAETDQPPPQVPAQWLALGSADPQSPYRMVVTVTNQGAAVETIELNQPRFRALEQESPGGYFGYLAATDSANPPGALVNVVAPGTPAALAGLQVGDTIQSLAGEPVGAADDLRTVLASKTKPGQSVPVEVSRGGQTLTREVALIRPPGGESGRPRASGSVRRATLPPVRFVPVWFCWLTPFAGRRPPPPVRPPATEWCRPLASLPERPACQGQPH